MTPQAELLALGTFYGTSVDGVLAQHGRALERYAEWVLARAGFAVVTLGEAEALARCGSPIAADRLEAAATRWPEAITGIKLDPAGREEPTLYVRAVCPWQEGARWLRRELGLELVGVPAARTLYGLGFQGELVKTYALAPDGFVSWRLDSQGPRREYKEYRQEVAWDAIAWPDARWAALGGLGRTLGFEAAGHVGRSSDTGELKIYVERVGGIPTNRSFS